MPNMIVENRGFSMIALDNPKTSLNVACALRACGIYGAAGLVTSGIRYKKHPADTMKAHRHLPMLQTEDVFDAIPYDCVPVAIELVEGAEDLSTFVHPERAFYIFGAEDNTLGSRILNRCKHVVYVPSNGCMNLAACVNVVLYDRLSKAIRKCQLS